MKYKISAALLCLLTCNIVRAQVNLVSGKADFNLPLFSYSDANRLNLSVSLQYTGGGGVRVNELASDVGLGWALAMGGAITRQQNGEPDDQVRDPMQVKYFDGYMYTTYSPSATPNVNIGFIPLVNGFSDLFPHESWAYDRAQDIYHYNFRGKSGSFVISKAKEIIKLKQDRVKISLTEENMVAQQILTRISKFVITDDDGIQYTFSEKQLSKIFTYRSGGDPITVQPDYTTSATHSLHQGGAEESEYSIVTHWLLSEIKNPLTGQAITLNYEPYTISYKDGWMPTQGRVTVNGQLKTNIMATRPSFKGTLKRPVSVIFPDTRRIDFEYNTQGRADMANTNSLNRVLMSQGGSVQSGFRFGYKYFSKADLREVSYSFPLDEQPYARLCLTSVWKTGKNGTEDIPYEFSYYQGPGRLDRESWVPARASLMQDFYGFANAIEEGPYQGSNTFQTAQYIYHNLDRYFVAEGRNARPYTHSTRGVGGINTNYLVAQNGALKTIKLPGGGTLHYNYEANTARKPDGTAEVIGGIRVKSIKVHDGISSANDLNQEYKYTLEDGTTSGQGYEVLTFTENKRNYLKRPSSSSFSAANMGVSIATYPGFFHFSTEYMNGYGKLLDRDFKRDQINSIRNTLILAVVNYLVTKLFGNAGSISYSDTEMTYFAPLQAGNPLPSFYSRVEVINGTASNNKGKTVYEYTTDKDCPLLVPTLSFPYSERPRYIPWALSELKRQRTYDANNNLLNEIRNEYDIFYEKIPTKSAKISPRVTFTAEVSSNGSASSYVQMAIDQYDLYTGRMEMKSQFERHFAPDGSYKENRIDFQYSNTDYLSRKITSYTEKGEKAEKRIYYPQDYTIPGVMQSLKTANILSQVVATENWLVGTTNGERMIDMAVNEFQQVSNGDFRMTKTYGLETSAPVPLSIALPFNSGVLIRKTDLVVEKSQRSYSGVGLMENSYGDGRVSSTLYNDHSDVAIAVIKNATVDQIAYSSFESGATGNWVVVGNNAGAYVTDQYAPTGFRGLQLSGITRLEKGGLNVGNRYSLSLWTKGGSINISGANIVRQQDGETANGWTMKVYTIDVTGPVTLTGSGIIDELRLYPANAAMRTEAYDACGNVVTICTEDNGFSRFEYDDLYRRTTERDLWGNVIRYTEYKPKMQ